MRTANPARLLIAAFVLVTPVVPCAADSGPNGLPVIQATAIRLPDRPVAQLTPIDVTTLYLNESSAPFTASNNPPQVLQNIILNALPSALTSIEFRFTVIATTNLRVEVRLWDDIDPNASPVNTDFIGGVNYDFGTLTAGTYTSSTLALPPGLSPEDESILVQFDYRNATTGALTTATVAFAGNGATVGNGPDIYYSDANVNGLFDPAESFGIGGSPPNLANFYLHLRGVFPYAAEPGYDLFETPAGNSFIDFSATPIPDNFFGLGSVAFTGTVILRGEPLATTPPFAIYPTDTVIHRLDSVPLHDPNSSGNTRIEVTALRLFSVDPLNIEFSDPPRTEQWNFEVTPSSTDPPLGTMTIARGACEGGTFTATLYVQPRFVFRKVGGGGFLVLDTAVQGWPPVQFGPVQGHWLDFDPNFSLRVPTATVQVDSPNASPVEPPLAPFFPGVRIERCGGACAGPGFARMTMMLEEAPFATHAVIPVSAIAPPDNDTDGLRNNSDNCMSIYNPFQEDADDDAVGDVCDNCPMVCNVNQADSDMDGRGDVCEVPEILSMTLSGGRRATLTWGQVGPPEVYDILKSDSKNLSVGTECLRQNYPVNTVDDTALPNFGQIRYYLPRVVNATGTGPWGYSSAGGEIMSSVCNGGGTTCRDTIDYLTATVPPPGPGATVTFCAPTADCIAGGTTLARSRASDRLCQSVYGAACATNDDCAGANGCCADKVTGADLTLGACAVVAPDTCAGTDVRCTCPYTVPPDPAPPAVGFRCDCVCQTGACPQPP